MKVNCVGPPLVASDTLPLMSQPSSTAPAARVTGSEKVTESLVSTGTAALPSTGEVALTVGGRSGTGKVWLWLQVPKVLAAAARQVKSA